MGAGDARIGVVASTTPVMAEGWEAGQLVEAGALPTIADGLAVRVAIPYAVDVLARAAQPMLRVDEHQLALAIRAMGAAGVGVAASGAARPCAALPQGARPSTARWC